MVRPIGAIKITCIKCNWEKSMFFKSDVLFGMPDKCQKCGSDKLEMKKDNSLKSKLLDLVFKS